MPSFLTRWSHLEASVWEARAGLKLAKYLDVRVTAAADATATFTRDVMVPTRALNAALIDKALDLQGYEPPPRYRELWRRWALERRMRPALASPAAAPLQDLQDQYFALAWPAAPSPGQPPAAAWHAAAEAAARNREPLAQLLVEIVRARRDLARAAGFADYRDYRWAELGRLDFTPADVAAVRQAVAERWPHALRRSPYRGLRPWEVAAAIEARAGQLPWRDVDQLLELAGELLASVGLGQEFAALREGGMLHLRTEANAELAPVSETFTFPASGRPCVFVATRGTFEDLPLLLHEVGHAAHDHLSLVAQGDMWNMGACDELAEMMANATALLPLREAKSMREALLARWFVQYLPDLCLQDAFAEWVNAQEPAALGADALDARWLALTGTYFGHLDWRGSDASGGWQHSRSLFTSPGYAFAYAFAQVGAALLLKEPGADLASAMRLGGSVPLREAVARLGIPSPLDPAVVGSLVDLVR